jgi:hypothetical protein
MISRRLIPVRPTTAGIPGPANNRRLGATGMVRRGRMDFPPHGALAFWGGGHGGGDDVGLTVFDFSTGLWSRIGPDNPAAQYSGADGESGLDPVFYDYLHEGSYIVPALHTYNYPAYVPPNLPGSGPKGSWLMPQLVGGTKSGAIPHAVNLETGEWTRFSNGRGLSGQSPYAGSIEDTRRNRVYWAAISGATLNMLDLNEVHPRSIQQVAILPRGTIFVHGGYYARHVYVPESDMAVGFWCRYQETLLRSEVLDLSPGTPVSRGAPALARNEHTAWSRLWCGLVHAHAGLLLLRRPRQYSSAQSSSPAVWSFTSAVGPGVRRCFRTRYSTFPVAAAARSPSPAGVMYPGCVALPGATGPTAPARWPTVWRVTASCSCGVRKELEHEDKSI